MNNKKNINRFDTYCPPTPDVLTPENAAKVIAREAIMILKAQIMADLYINKHSC